MSKQSIPPSSPRCNHPGCERLVSPTLEKCVEHRRVGTSQQADAIDQMRRLVDLEVLILADIKRGKYTWDTHPHHSAVMALAAQPVPGGRVRAGRLFER